MLNDTSRWSHTRGNTVVPSRWQATAQGGRGPGGWCAVGRAFHADGTRPKHIRRRTRARTSLRGEPRAIYLACVMTYAK